MNVSNGTSSNSHCTKTARFKKTAEGRFASVYSVEEFILKQENKNATQKTERDVRFLVEDRKMEVISGVELNGP